MLAEEELDGSNVIVEYLGEWQGFSHQPGAPLAEGTIEPFHVIGILFLLAIQMLSLWDDGFVTLPIIGVEQAILLYGSG